MSDDKPTEQPLLELLDRLNALYVSRDQIDDFAIEVEAAYPRLSRELRALTERLALLKSMNRDGVAALAEVEDLRVQLCERDALRAQLAEALAVNESFELRRDMARMAHERVAGELETMREERDSLASALNKQGYEVRSLRTQLDDMRAEIIAMRQLPVPKPESDQLAEAKAEIKRLREAFGSHMIGRIVELDGRYHSWMCLNCCPEAAAETEATIPHTDDCPLRVKP